MVTESEGHKLLVQWNDTEAEYPRDKCIHQLFEERVERTADAVAVVFESQQLTYRQLNAKANQLANYLPNLGVGPEVLVGLCVDRSLETIVGLLGILKAFDIAGLELYLPLVVGARVAIPRQKVVSSGQVLAKLIDLLQKSCIKSFWVYFSCKSLLPLSVR